MREKAADAIVQDRESVISSLEEADRRMRRSGVQRKWFQGTDERVLGEAGGVNGTLPEALLRSSGYCD
eukprot:7217020-Karenia_brevis.AAC.1